MQAAQDLFSPGAGHAMGLSNGETGYQALTNAPGAFANSGSAQQASQNTGISLHVGIGGGSSTSTAKTHDDVAYGSQISSQGNVTIAATNGDLTLVGSQVNGNDVALSASHDLNLLSQAEQHTDSNTSHNASGEVGLSIGQTTGIYLSASAGEALAHGNGTTHDDTVVNAANTLTLVSGNDTTIRGAQATGNTVLANIGGNLDIASEQDTNDYASHSIQAGITLVYGWSNGGVGVSGSLSASKAKSNYASVTQMSGIGAGNGGFDIDVHGKTDLTGAVIASMASPVDNLLTTGSLTYSNIENVAKSSAESLSVGGGYGTGSLSGMTSLTGGIGVPQNSDQHSTTQAGIAAGMIVVGNDTSPDLSGLDRNPSLDNANGLANSFNPRKVVENQQVGLLAGQVGMTAAGDLASYEESQAQASGDKTAQAAWAAGGTNEVLLHTVVGGAVAALGGGNATQGALGAGLGEASIPYLTQFGNGGVLAGSTLIGALVGGGAGASTALAGTRYNYLSHSQIAALKAALQSCTSQADCQQILNKYLALSQQNDAALDQDCASSPSSGSCQDGVREALNYAVTPASSYWTSASTNLSSVLASDINLSQGNVLNLVMTNVSAYGAINTIDARANFFGAMYQQTGAPWFGAAQETSTQDLMGVKFTVGNFLTGGGLASWRYQSGEAIMQNDYNGFVNVYQNYQDPSFSLNSWSLQQLVNEQSMLQSIYEQQTPATKAGIWGGGLLNYGINPMKVNQRIEFGCTRMASFGYQGGCQ